MAATSTPENAPGGNAPSHFIARWVAIPLYWRILAGMAIGIGIGLALGDYAAIFAPISRVILQLLGALAPPLILVAVIHVLITSEIPPGSARRLAGLLFLNTSVAILIGLAVANVLQPGKWFDESDKAAVSQIAAEQVSKIVREASPEEAENTGPQIPESEVSNFAEPTVPAGDTKSSTPDRPTNELETGGAEVAERDGGRVSPFGQLIASVPKSILGPLGDNQNVIGVIIIAVAFGIALRRVKSERLDTLENFVEIAYKTLLIVLHWIIELVPLGVACVVAGVIGTEGFGAFFNLGAFVLAVLLALSLQACWYLVRIHYFSWVHPWQVLKGMRDALVMAFSTDSSTATMPVTYECLREKVGVSENSASLGALVGANFNNDGTALYEAMAALFIAQLLGMDLDFTQQLAVVATSILASVGAAGIPEAGIVTMTLVFKAVGLPLDAIAILLAVDWFLDRCRTTINVLGDVNVSCLLDGRTPPENQQAA